MDTPPPSTSPLEGEDVHGSGVGAAGPSTDDNPPVIPEDGYKWKKYGKKYIKKKKMNRAYFKCRNKTCNVKKRVEWPPSDPRSSLRISYDGAHNHPATGASASASASSSTAANRYDLANQVFGLSSDTSQDP